MSNGTMIQRSAWAVKRFLVRLRWPGVLGLGLLVFAVGLYAFSSQTGTSRLRALKQEANSIAARMSGRGSQQQVATSRSQLSNFYAFFPLMVNLPELLGRIDRAANEHGLVLEKGEYRLMREQDFNLLRYQIELPVRGEYADVRGFVNDVLAGIPASSLEELTLKRESIEIPQLEARVRFVLFLGAE